MKKPPPEATSEGQKIRKGSDMTIVDHTTDMTKNRIQKPTDVALQIAHLEQQFDTALAIRELTPGAGPTPIDADTVNRIRGLSHDELMEYAQDTLDLITALRRAS